MRFYFDSERLRLRVARIVHAKWLAAQSPEFQCSYAIYGGCHWTPDQLARMKSLKRPSLQFNRIGIDVTR